MTYPENLFYGATPTIHQRARELRKRMTHAEKFLWEILRGKTLGGAKFRRQHPIYMYVVDFYCHSLKLVIELDGAVHDSEEASIYDQNRTLVLEEFGLKVIRFKNEEVKNEPAKVLTILQDVVSSKLSAEG